jgi:hypothetical protein
VALPGFWFDFRHDHSLPHVLPHALPHANSAQLPPRRKSQFERQPELH